MRLDDVPVSAAAMADRVCRSSRSRGELPGPFLADSDRESDFLERSRL